MPDIVVIVEGQGEIEAVPLLCRNILAFQNTSHISIGVAINAAGKGNITKIGGIERLIQAAGSEENCAAVLVLLDADEDCAATLAQDLAARAIPIGTKFSVAVVCAKCEYETWLIASSETIAGHELSAKRSLPAGIMPSTNVEEIHSAKGWISRQFGNGRVYKPTQDQLPMTRLLDIALVRGRSRSFRRLYHALEELTSAIDAKQTSVPTQ